MNNRKARLMMRVPARAVGDISYYHVTNSRRLCYVGMLSGIEKRRMNQRQNKQAILLHRYRMESAK